METDTTDTLDEDRTAQTALEDIDTSSKIWAATSYLWVLCFLPLFFKRDDDYVLFHARQGLLLFVGWCFFLLVSVSPILGHPLWHLGNLLVLILNAVGVYHAVSGRRASLPLIGNAAKEMMLS